MKPEDPWIRIQCRPEEGRRFNLANPTYKDFRLEEIAHNLSRINRYTGSIIPEHYSVAEHSARVAFYTLALMPTRSLGTTYHNAFRAGLMHDAAEAYLNDMSSPLKRLPAMWGYCRTSDRYDSLIMRAFHIFPAISYGIDAVHAADMAVFDLEHPRLQPGKGPRAKQLSKLAYVPDAGVPAKYAELFGTWGWRPNVAKEIFLELAVAYGNMGGYLKP